MKMLVLAFATVAIGLNVCTAAEDAKAAPAPQPKSDAKVAPAEEKDDSFDLFEAIGLLNGNSIVLEVGDKKVAWRDVHPMVSRILKANKKESDRPTTEKRIHEFFQSMASRGLLLNEAEAMNITVTDEERKAFEEDLERNLAGNDRGMTKEKYIASFNKNGSNMANLSFDDVLKLIKLDKIKFGNVAITDLELAAYIRYRNAMNEAIKQKNAETRKAFESLMTMEGINTDDGFMKLARAYSEGRESENGGVLNYDFTRADLAEINDLKSFDWKVGETTPVLETEYDLRIMRILAAIPPEKDGEPEKYRVAQILHGKIALMDNSNKEALKAEMLTKKKKKAIDDFVLALQNKYKVTSRLFPDGLWPQEEPQKNNKRMPERVNLNDALKEKTAKDTEKKAEK